MNILLFAPALFLAYLSTQGLFGTFKQLIICASIQLILAYPFLSTYPWSYIKVKYFSLVFAYLPIAILFYVLFAIQCSR